MNEAFFVFAPFGMYFLCNSLSFHYDSPTDQNAPQNFLKAMLKMAAFYTQINLENSGFSLVFQIRKKSVRHFGFLRTVDNQRIVNRGREKAVGNKKAVHQEARSGYSQTCFDGVNILEVSGIAEHAFQTCFPTTW